MTSSKAFLGINLDLIENPKYNSLDSRAMMLYALYADRNSASLHNAKLGNTAFVDNMGVFIRFTNELAATILHTSEKMIGKFRKQLESVGLIEIARDGLKGYKIYVKSVSETPSNVDLVMPWKNHHIETTKSVSDWTTFSKINYYKNLQITAQTTDMTVKSQREGTCSPNGRTSLSHISLSQNIYNNIDLVDHAPARTKVSSTKQNPYKSLPDEIKKAFNSAFGFITTNVAVELHALIKRSNAEMVCYAIDSAKNRKITSPINYLKASITNALKRGEKCVQDMVEFYEKNVKGLRKQRSFMTKAQAEKAGKQAEERFAKEYPEKRANIIQRRNQPAPMIPIFKLV